MQPQELRKIAEGREAEMFEWGEGRILRLLRDADAHSRNQWQAAAMEAARRRGVRVPAVYELVTVNGRPGLVMERLEGTDLLTLIGRRPWMVFAAARVGGEVHARMHEVVAPSALPPLREVMRRRIEGRAALPEDLKALALGALEALPDGDRLCHGDLNPANVIVSAGQPVVIDWTNASRGDPAADVARSALILRLGEPPPGTAPPLRVMALFGRRLLIALYLRSYRRHRPLDMEAMRRWEVPVTAARVADGIEEERARLVALLERAAEQASS